MHKPAVFLTLAMACAALAAGKPAASQAQRIPAPPLMKGGVAGLWANDHEFIKSTYGDFELLNLDNTTYRIKHDTITDKTWQLVGMGNFLSSGLQFATLARVKNRPEGTLLIMFEWKDPADSTAKHGIFFHTFLNRSDLLVRTKQGRGGVNDTLEFSCADLQRTCGKCYFNPLLGGIKVEIVDK